jgi:hypothetical protein
MAQTQHGHARTPDTYLLPEATWGKVRNSIVFLALVSWVALAIGAYTNRAQFHFSYLTAFAYFSVLAVGAMFYVMIQHLTGSAWSVTVRRIMENIMRAIPVGIVLFLPVALGIHQLYEWSHAEAAKDPLIAKKLGYLNETWFLIRAGIVLGLWSLWSWKLYSFSRKQDESGSLEYTKRAEKWSAPGALMLFVTASIASFDWLMSLEPHWWSTMFGVYTLAGGALAFMAFLILICLGFRRAGYLTSSINEEHYHDLGKWLFALTVFWAYVTFSQYMLIWYSNMPEETFWFKKRFVGSWEGFVPFLIFFHFAIPFFALMPRASKRNLKFLGFFAVWMAVMHYFDLHWVVMPVLHGKGFAPHWLDLAAFCAVGSAYALVFWSGFRKKPLVPVGDPRLEQCLAFHNA